VNYKQFTKEARELMAEAKALNTSWKLEYLSIKDKDRIDQEKLLDTDPNHIRVVIYTS
tara:strand:+ start:58 stop:231 length:174 start_codon:yes stop_codon:yes gene_type:complete